MKRQKVFLLAGVPGSGKSTWIRQQINTHGGTWCSRDAVRFSMVKEDEPYFSQEDRVFQSWIDQIQNAINRGENVYIDATHINANSRRKVLKSLKLNGAELIGVNVMIPLNESIRRNNLRKGREKVPEKVITKMYYDFSPITITEGFDAITNIFV